MTREEREKKVQEMNKNYERQLRIRRAQEGKEDYFRRVAEREQSFKPTEDILSENVRRAQKERDDYKNSDESIGFWEAVFKEPTLEDWKKSRTKRNQLNDAVDDAQGALDAYKVQRDSRFARTLDVNELEKHMAELEAKNNKIPGRVAGAMDYWGAALSGDSAKAAEIHDKNLQNYAQKNKIDSELAMYRNIRNEKKSAEVLKDVPDDVIKLLDDYNTAKFLKQDYQIYSLRKQLSEKGYDDFEELSDYRAMQTNKERNFELQKANEELAREHPVLSSIGSTVVSAPAAVLGALGNIDMIDNKAGIDTNSPYYELTNSKNSIRNTVSANMESGILSRNKKAFLYQTAMSGADSLIASAMPGGEVLLGMGAMNDAVIDIAQKGGSKSQALLGGLAAGTFETLFEHLSIGQLNAFKEMPVTSVKSALTNIGKATLTNFSEEAATELANIVYDYLANGGTSDYYELVQSYVDSGLSEDEAKKQAYISMGKRIADAGLGGALMGGTFGAVGSAMGAANYNNQMKYIGKDIAESGEVEKLLAGSADVSSDGKGIFSKFLNKVTATEDARTKEAESNVSLEQSEEGSASETVPEFKYKNKDYRNIGKLSEALKERTESDSAEITRTAVKERLDNLGENSDNIDRLSNAVVKSIQGEKLKSKESSLLNQSKYARQVIGEYFSDRSSESSAWADSADEKAGNLFARRYNPDIEAYRNRGKSAEESEGNISQPTTIDEVIKANEGKYTAYAAGLLEASYNDGREHNPTALEKTFDQFYTLGKEGRDFEQYASMEVADDNFTYEQRQNAFNAGVKAAEIGKRTKLAEISKITSDDIIVKDNEGNEISLSEVNTSPETIRLFKEAATYHNTEAANAFISGFNGTSSFASYRDAFKAFYSAGAGNTKISAQEFVENGEYAPLFKSIDKDTAAAAFNYGKKFASAERNKAKATPKVTRKAKGEYKNFVGGSKEMDEVYTAVAKKLGIDIHKVQNVFAENGLEANAQFDPNLFRITISGEAMSEFTDFTHELGHVAEDFGDSKKAQLAKDAILNWYTEQYGDIEREDLIYSVMQQYGNISHAEAIDEVVNEAIAKLFSDEKNVQKFLDWLRNKSGYSEKERKTIIQRITDALKRIIDAIKEIIAGGELSEVAEEFAGMQQDKADEILKLFFEALDSAAENYKKSAEKGGKAKYSVKKGKAKTSYNEFNTNAMQWAYSEDTQIGDIKSIYNPSSDKFVVLKATKRGIGFECLRKRKINERNVKNENLSRTGNSNGRNDSANGTRLRGNGNNGNISGFSAGNGRNDRISKEKSESYNERNLERSGSDNREPSGEQSGRGGVKYSLKPINSEGKQLSKEQQEFFKNVSEELLDKEGRLKPFYHGTARADRVGNYFDPERATSGPMVFFTDNSQIAENYSRDKADTSIAYDSDYDSYETQFRVNVGGESVPVVDYWKRLSLAERNSITQKAEQLTFDDDYENLVLKPGNKYGLGGLDLRYARGNALQALVDSWLTDGNLYGEEKRFLEVLEKVGVKNVEYKDPDYREEKVYKVYLNVTNPLVTSDVDEYFIADLEDYIENTDMSMYEKDSASADMWDKNDRDIYDWIDSLRNDIENNTTYAWTVIPDVVTDFLKDYGKYDGIVDTGGKQGGEIHRVVIPFYSNQIKNVDNLNPTSQNPDIRYSLMRKKGNANKIYNKDGFKMTGREIAMLDSAVMKKNSYNGNIKGTVSVYSNNYYYVVSNTDWGLYTVKQRLDPETDYDLIEITEAILRNVKNNENNGTADGDIENLIFLQGDRQGRRNVYSADAERGRTAAGNDRLHSKSQESDQLGTSRSSTGNLEGKGKYSLGVTDLEKQNKSLLSQNKEYERIIADLKRQLKNPDMRHFVDFNKTRGFARKLKSDYSSSINITELSSDIGELFNFIANSKQLNWDVVSVRASGIAEKVLKSSKNMKPEISEASKSILDDIRSVGISLSEEQKQEAAYRFGSYGNFYKSSFGSLKIRNNGIPLDSRWQELCESYPGIFDKNASEADQAVLLLEAVQTLKNTYSDESGFDYDSARDMLIGEIFEAYFEVPETQSLSSEYQRKLFKVRDEYRNKLAEAKEQYKRDNLEMLRQAKKEYGENLANIRSKYGEELLKNKARYNQRVENMQNTNSRAQSRKYIISRVKRLDVLLRKPTNTNNIPEAFQKSVLSLCETFTDDTSVFDYKRLDEVRKAYAAIRATNPSEETSISGSYDFDIESDLERLKETISGKRLAQLSLKELDIIRDVLDHFSTVIKNETEIFINGKKQTLERVGSTALKEMQAKGIKKSRFGDSKIKTTIAVDNLTPTYAFEDVGGILKTLYGDIRRGQDKYVRTLEPAKRFFEALYKKYNVSKWGDDSFTLKTSRDEKLTFTSEQAMLIYATAKREQMSGQESKHLLSGGIVFENQITASEKGSKKPWAYKSNDKTAHPLSYEDILQVSSFLTAEQKNYVDEMVKYLSTDMAELGNEVSMQLYGIRKFKERYYIPFNSADSFGYRKFGESFDSRLKNMSMTKATVKGAATPLVLSDFTTVWANHVERMAAYNALVIPLENFTKVWNYKTMTTDAEANASVSSAFESAMGTDYKKYVEQLMKDINGNVMSDGRVGGMNSLIRKFKKNAVFASMSVMIQQPSAVCRAFALVDPKYFVKTTFSKRDYEECMRYCPVAVLKEIGGFDTTSGRNMVDWMTNKPPEGFKEKFKEFFNLKDSSYRDEILSWGPGFADRVTWAHIWNAVKAETRAKTGLSGEALLEKAGERFSEVIDKTQVYDSVLSRSGLMRSKQTGMQMATAFMAEPTLSFNMLYDGVKQAKKGNKRYGAAVLGAFVLNTLLNAGLKSIITAARNDDDDKTYFEKYIAELISNFSSDVNPMSLIPFAKDVISIFQGYDVSRADMSLFSDLYDSVQSMFKDSSSMTEKITGFAGALGGFLGVPAKNIIRDINSAKNVINGAKAGNKTTSSGVKYAVDGQLFPILKNLGAIKSTKKAERLFDAWTDGDAEMYNRMAAQYSSGQAVKTALSGQIKNEFLSGAITEGDAVDLLIRLDYDYSDSVKKISKWQEPNDVSDEDEADKYEKFTSYKTMSN